MKYYIVVYADEEGRIRVADEGKAVFTDSREAGVFLMTFKGGRAAALTEFNLDAPDFLREPFEILPPERRKGKPRKAKF